MRYGGGTGEWYDERAGETTYLIFFWLALLYGRGFLKTLNVTNQNIIQSIIIPVFLLLLSYSLIQVGLRIIGSIPFPNIRDATF